MEHNFEQLKAHILPLSMARTFDRARFEWDLVEVELSRDFDNCPCGQRIKEHCYIRNRETQAETYVGNVCIERFMGIDTGSLFDGLRRIAENPRANANDDVIQYAEERGYLFDKEYDFPMSTRLKRNLTPKQRDWKEKINKRILNHTVVQRRTAR